MKRKLLSMAVALLCTAGTWAYQTPAADGIYYLYNTACTDGNPGFISRGEDYTKRAVISQFGIPIQLISTDTEDTYYFQLYDTKGYLSDDGFMYTDGGIGGQSKDRRRAIKVVSQGDGKYKLINTNNGKEVEDWYGHPVGDGTGNRHNYIWQFLSPAEYEAVVAGYTQTQDLAIASTMNWTLSEQTTAGFNSFITNNCFGVDRTSLIQSASFDATNHTTTGWTITPNTDAELSLGWGNEATKTTPEVYQNTADKAIGGTISQTVSVAAAGVYKVSVNAFYRSRNNAALLTAGASGSVAYLQANNNKVRIGDIYYSLDNTNTLPSGPTNANDAFFANGKYLNEVYVYVPEDAKTITITLGIPSHNETGWFVFNNFKLTYIVDASAVITKAQTLSNSAMEATAKSGLTSALSSFQSARDESSYEALEAAIVTAENSAAIYTKIAEAITIIKAKDNNATLANTIDTKYNNGTYTAVNEVYADYYAYKTPNVTFEAGADLTEALLFNAAGNLGTTTTVQSWTCTNTQAFHINTWSVEGNAGNDPSGMTTPFIENWIAKGGLLGDATIAHPTITNLTPGVYRVAGLMRVYSESGNDPSGVSIYANSASKDILANGTSFTYNNMKGVYAQMEVTTEVGEDGILNVGYTIKDATFNWLSFKNFTLTYVSVAITEEDASALIATAPTTAAMNSDVKTALTNAVTALQNERNFTNYNALVAAISNANLSASAYTAAKTAIDKAKATVAETNFYTAAAKATWDELISGYETAYTNGTWTNDQANAIDAAIWGQRSSKNRNDGALNALLRSVWNVMDSNTWSTEFDTEDSQFTTPFFEYWTANNSTLGARTYSATMTELPEGVYTVSALVRTRRTDGNTATPAGITLQVSNGAAVDVANGTLTDGYYLGTFSANAIVRADGKLTVSFSAIAGNNISWFTFKNLKYEAVADASSLLATAEDYTALNNALNSKTLGFDKDEYAPYTAPAEFIAAKTIDQNVSNLKAYVNAATTALANATWEANAAEVNAVYNPTFALSTNDMTALGWSADDNSVIGNESSIQHSRSFVGNANLAAFGNTSNSALYLRFDGTNSTVNTVYQYGKTDGYTMPLKNASYRIQAQIGNWAAETDRWAKEVRVSLKKKSDDTEVAGQTLTTPNSSLSNAGTTDIISFNFIANVDEAGDYYLAIDNAGSTAIAIVVSNLSIVKAVATDVTIAEIDAAAPAVNPLADVTLTRTLKGGQWNGFSVPFGFTVAGSALEGASIKEYASVTDNEITLKDATEVVAGKPYLVKPESDIVNPTFSGVAVENPDEVVEGSGDYKFAAHLYNTSLATDGSIAYVSTTDSSIKKLTSGSIKGLRSVFQIPVASGGNSVKALVIRFADTTDGIISVDADGNMAEGAIYNLAGQRMSRMQKGINIVGGKKVLVK